MFGYIRVHSPQLRVWENELYKSVYCGLCKYGGEHTTKLTRFILSYDFVALALFRMALNNEKLSFKKGFCPYAPKKKMMLVPNSSLTFTADAFALLSYYKLLDDKKDSKGIKRIIFSIPPVFLKNAAFEAEKRCKGLGEEIRNELSRLDLYESEGGSSIDEAADFFAVLLGKVLSFGLSERESRIAYEAGYHMGRYIYIIDALDDYQRDLKEKNYNPLVNTYKSIDELKKNLDLICDTLKASLKRVMNALELIDNKDIFGIIENILTFGADSVISKTVNKYCD